jgi:hypothetical protein
MKDFFANQIALAMLVFMMIVVGAFWVLDGATAKDVIIQVITAVCALVTGQQMEKSKVQRALDKVDELQADAKVEVVKAQIAKVVETVKNGGDEDAKI